MNTLKRVSKIGSAGDSPAPVGDPPTGTPASNFRKRPYALARTVALIPSEKPALALLRSLRHDLEMSGRQVNYCPVVWAIQGATGAAGPEHVDDDLAGWLWRRDSGVLIAGRRQPAMAGLPQLE